MNEHCMKNNIYWPDILKGVLIAVIGFIAINLLIAISGWMWQAIIIGLGTALACFMLPVGLLEFFIRPKMVEFGDDGITLYYRVLRKPKQVIWRQITRLTLLLEIKPEYGKDVGRDCDLRYDGNKHAILNRSIGLAIRKSYLENMGKYPPMGDIYIGNMKIENKG
jgi:hypothetical protein